MSIVASPNVANILKNAGIDSKESKVVRLAADDQLMAKERDMLVQRGVRVCGWGITGERIEWASDVLAYAFRVSSGKKGEFVKAIDNVHACVNAQSKGMDISDKNGRDQTLHMSIKLAMISQKAPQVKFLDWGVASMFSRFLKAYNPAQPELDFEPECIALAAKIAMRDQSFLTKRGGIDKKKVKDAIKTIFGDVVEDEKTESAGGDVAESEVEATPAVTSEEAIAAWFASADETALDTLGKLLGDRAGIVAKHWLTNLHKYTA